MPKVESSLFKGVGRSEIVVERHLLASQQQHLRVFTQGYERRGPNHQRMLGGASSRRLSHG